VKINMTEILNSFLEPIQNQFKFLKKKS